MPEIRTTVSDNLPDGSQADRVTRAALREASAAGAAHHHENNLKNHFEGYSGAKYGMPFRSAGYRKFKEKLARLGLIPQANVVKYLVLTGRTRDGILGSRQIRVTGTRGATLIVTASMEGLASGRFLTIEAVKRMIDAAGNDDLKRKRLEKKLRRLAAAGGELTMKQAQQLQRIAEIQAIAPSELSGIAKVEEATFAVAYKNALRNSIAKRVNRTFSK